MEFWFEQFKARYLTVLYPRVMKQMGYELGERTCLITCLITCP
jgi:hypothetical protein